MRQNRQMVEIHALKGYVLTFRKKYKFICKVI